MANFEVLIEVVGDVTDHPNADRLSIVKIRGYNCISAKLDDGSHRYKQGDLVVYVPEGAVVPDYLLRDGYWDEKKNQGILAGSKGNRVKAIKLRDIVSQGLIFPIKTESSLHVFEWYIPAKITKEDREFYKGDSYTGHATLKYEALSQPHTTVVGMNVAEILGIIKYEPPIPPTMAGEVQAKTEYADNYDIENYKKYTEIFEEGEVVDFTEKLHGTNCRFIISKDFIGVTSKGLGKQGLIFKDNDNNAKNLYVRMMHQLMPALKRIQVKLFSQDTPMNNVYIYGEIYGNGVQDLVYDAKDFPKFRVFDIKFNWHDGSSTYLSLDDIMDFITEDEVEPLQMVPLVYSGPFSVEKLIEETNAPSLLGGGIREGIVVKPVKEATNQWIGRKFLKSVSDAYLTRKGGTELQ